MASLKASRNFPAILQRALHRNRDEAVSHETVIATTVTPITAQVPADQLEQRQRTLSIRIVLPSRTVLRFETVLAGFKTALSWTRQLLQSRQTRKRLRVCETVSLGDKRFVAVIEVDGEQFLLGGASSSITAIARLEPSPKIPEAVDPLYARDSAQA